MVVPENPCLSAGLPPAGPRMFMATKRRNPGGRSGPSMRVDKKTSNKKCADLPYVFTQIRHTAVCGVDAPGKSWSKNTAYIPIKNNDNSEI
jgi:hypothetical protein